MNRNTFVSHCYKILHCHSTPSFPHFSFASCCSSSQRLDGINYASFVSNSANAVQFMNTVATIVELPSQKVSITYYAGQVKHLHESALHRSHNVSLPLTPCFLHRHILCHTHVHHIFDFCSHAYSFRCTPVCAQTFARSSFTLLMCADVQCTRTHTLHASMYTRTCAQEFTHTDDGGRVTHSCHRHHHRHHCYYHLTA